MEVILLEKVSKLGNLGDRVRVKRGFGRNFLIPQGKALPATEANILQFEARRSELEKIALSKLETAKKRAAALEGLALRIEANAGDEGRLFGSVGPYEIARAAKTKGHDIQKSELNLPEGPIRQVGDYEIIVHFEGEVTAKIQVSVVAA